jgi:hypothetical protein
MLGAISSVLCIVQIPAWRRWNSRSAEWDCGLCTLTRPTGGMSNLRAQATPPARGASACCDWPELRLPSERKKTLAKFWQASADTTFLRDGYVPQDSHGVS